MMSKFIELHFPIEDKVFFNVEDILCFFTRDDDTIIRAKDGNCYAVTESFDEVKVLIKDAGVLIHKPDPRLDTTTPLTMEDLKYMEGEPVWNSNTLKWMLIYRFVDADKPIVWLVRHDSQFELMTADDLIKTPLYRIKKETK